MIKDITNQSEWERFWQKTSPQSFFQSWGWGEVEKKLGKKVWRIGYYQNSELVGIAQLVKVTARRGNFLHVRHGPIFSTHATLIQKKQWLKWMTILADHENCSFIRISPLVDVTIGNAWSQWGFRQSAIHNMDAEVSMVVDLAKSHDQLLSGMRKTTRYLVRRSTTFGVTVQSGTTKQYLDDFLTIFNETADRVGFVSNRGIADEFATFVHEGNALIFLARCQDQLAAGALVIFSGEQGIYHYAATADALRHIPGAYLVQWEAMKETKRRGYRYYNLWGGIANSKDRSHPWYGLTMFKEGFGGITKSYQHASDLPLKSSYWKTYIAEFVIKYARGYATIGLFRFPSWVRRFLGV